MQQRAQRVADALQLAVVHARQGGVVRAAARVHGLVAGEHDRA